MINRDHVVGALAGWLFACAVALLVGILNMNGGPCK